MKVPAGKTPPSMGTGDMIKILHRSKALFLSHIAHWLQAAATGLNLTAAVHCIYSFSLVEYKPLLSTVDCSDVTILYKMFSSTNYILV